VAPECNIRCKYCNRRYDCANESRPGVTSRVLEPGDAVPYLDDMLKACPDTSVIGIAGPGDALSDPERTLETIRAVRRARPGLLFCLSTNGLNLPDHVDALAEAGVTHVTLTVNAVAPPVAEQIYDMVRINGTTYHGREAAVLLLLRQRESLIRLKAREISVKINTVILPGINDIHVEAIAGVVAALGADVMNCLPLQPVAGTPFSGMKPPESKAVQRIRKIASHYMPQMNHCRRCRADATGLLQNGPHHTNR
jgi:nitrogen fixation protein NifB